MGIFSNNPEDFRRGGKFYIGRSRRRNSDRGNGDIEVFGFTETFESFGRIMTNDPQMASIFKKFIRNVIKEARKKVSQDAKNYLKSDPRKAARAVKYSVYKSLFGGNVSILQKKAGSAGKKWMWIREKKLQPGQRGGNRILRDGERSRLDQYFGADRGFALRFVNGGTVNRTSRFGNRGSIRQTNWFGHTAPWHMEEAASQVAEAINEYVMKQANG
jgi:hypothetical protein